MRFCTNDRSPGWALPSASGDLERRGTRELRLVLLLAALRFRAELMVVSVFFVCRVPLAFVGTLARGSDPADIINTNF